MRYLRAMRITTLVPALLSSALLAACGGATGHTATPRADGMDRLRFNQLALRLDLPLFWGPDANGSGAPDPDEVHSLAFHDREIVWVENGAFTPAWDEALARIRAEHEAAAPADVRIAAVVNELDHAAPTLLSTDLRALPPAHQAFAAHMLVVAGLIDRLYARQVGMEALAGAVADDAASRALFRRNWGPTCRSSAEENDEACTAIAGVSEPPVDVYPASLQTDDGFCAVLEARPDAAALTGPFTVIRDPSAGPVSAFDVRDTTLVLRAAPGPAPMIAVPYSVAYADLMQPCLLYTSRCV